MSSPAPPLATSPPRHRCALPAFRESEARPGLGIWLVLLLVASGACSPGGGCAEARRSASDDAALPLVRGRAAATASPATNGATAERPRERGTAAQGRVVRVRDGDTIVVLRAGVGIEVRLDGVDCPELPQAFGRKAKSFTSGLAFGKTVRLVGKGKDRYGRELAEVFFPDGRSLNRELVVAGYAWWYRRYSTDRSLEALEQQARRERRGLWADDDPVPPWEFREAGRN